MKDGKAPDSCDVRGAEPQPTSTEQAFVSQTGEVVTLAVRSVDAPIGGQVADALPTVAVTPSAARGVPRGLPAGICAHYVLATLTVRTHVAGVADTYPTLEGAVPMVALGTVGFYFSLAGAVTFCTDEYFQGVPQSHRLYGKGSAFLAVGYAHSHVEGCLEKKTLLICFFQPPVGFETGLVETGSAQNS